MNLVKNENEMYNPREPRVRVGGPEMRFPTGGGRKTPKTHAHLKHGVRGKVA